MNKPIKISEEISSLQTIPLSPLLVGHISIMLLNLLKTSRQYIYRYLKPFDIYSYTHEIAHYTHTHTHTEHVPNYTYTHTHTHTNTQREKKTYPPHTPYVYARDRITLLP